MIALEVESWIWWSVVMVVAGSRFISRRMTLGEFRKFQADDYLMVIALCFYTTLIATINIVRDTSSNLLPPGYDINTLTKEDIKERTYGSKLILVVEQCQCATIWLVKGCLIILYLRLTTAQKEHMIVKVLAGYIVVTFIVMDSLYFGFWCRPFHNYWAVPTPNKQCDAATNHLIMNAVFNLTSDCAMLIVGLPMFWRLNLPLKKKIPVIGIFSLGIFTIVAAILNKIYSFSQPFGAEWTYWYTRESSTALLVANLPFVWTLFRRATGLQSIEGQSRNPSGDPTRGLSKSGTVLSSEGKPQSPSQWDRQDSLADQLEMNTVNGGGGGGGGGAGMTLAEMFKNDPPSGIDDAEANEITHPHLFYSRRKPGMAKEREYSLDKAVLNDTPERHTVRRSSSSERRLGKTPASSLFAGPPDSKKSVNSFV